MLIIDVQQTDVWLETTIGLLWRSCTLEFGAGHFMIIGRFLLLMVWHYL